MFKKKKNRVVERKIYANSELVMEGTEEFFKKIQDDTQKTKDEHLMEIGLLKSQKGQLENEINSQMAIISMLEGDNQDLRNNLNNTQNELDRVNSEIDRMIEEVRNEYITRIQELENSVEELSSWKKEALEYSSRYNENVLNHRKTMNIINEVRTYGVWNLNVHPNECEFDGLTFTRTEVDGQVFFKVEGDSTNVGTIKINYVDGNGDTKTTDLKVGQNNIIPNPPYAYNNIRISYIDFTSATITFVNISK